jgi:RHS repeat-associated protein
MSATSQNPNQASGYDATGNLTNANRVAKGSLPQFTCDFDPADYAGVLEQTCASLPFGDGLACTGSTTTPTEHHFTGKERDAETGNDYFLARYFASGMGRFLTPDWSAKVEPVPYAKMDDPQSLNLYAYVLNNPLSRIDPDGHKDSFCNANSALCRAILDSITNGGSILDGYGKWAQQRLQPKNFAPHPPSASLHTDMSGHTTTFTSTDIFGKTTTKTIETRNDIWPKQSEPGADAPYSTENIKGVSNRHAGDKAYGPAGAFIDTGDDTRGRDIHGGGSNLLHPLADYQGWEPTLGCTRGQNADVISLGQSITNSQHDPYESGIIPYSRNEDPQ